MMSTTLIAKLLIFSLLIISCSSSEIKDPLDKYEDSEIAVKLFPGNISIDGIQWNNFFAKNNQEMFYCQQLPGRAQLVSRVFDGKKYTSPKPIAFDTIYNYSDPFVNPSGNHLIFMSNKPYEFKKDSLTSDFQLWQSNKKDGAWTEPEIVFTTETGVGYPCRTNDGTLFYSLRPKDGSRNSNIYYSAFQDGQYGPPIKLPEEINTIDKFEGDAFIAMDKSFIIFASFDRDDNMGFSDLYISFNKGNNKWTKSKSLGMSINSAGYDGSPFVTQDGKYLVFTSSRNSPGENGFFNHYIVRFDASSYK